MFGAAAPTLCGRTQEKLHTLHEKHFGAPVWGTYFFTKTPPWHLRHVTTNDDFPRCLKCGCTIAEHKATADDYGWILCLPSFLFFWRGATPQIRASPPSRPSSSSAVSVGVHLEVGREKKRQ